MNTEQNKFESCYYDEKQAVKIPRFEGKHYLINGQIIEWKGKFSPVYSPIYIQGKNKKI